MAQRGREDASQLPTSSLKAGSLANWIEVRVVLRVRANPLRHVDRAPEVVDRVSRPSGEALAAGEVVEQRGVLRMRLGQSRATVGRLGVLARLVERAERRPELPAFGLVRLSGRAAECDDRRPGLLGERRSLHAGAGEDEGAGGRDHRSPSSSKAARPRSDEVELLVRVRLGLVVLVDDPVAGFAGRSTR